MDVIEIAIMPRAWRVEFVESLKALPDGVEAIEIAEPRNVTALLSPLAPSDALAQAGPQTVGALTVIWMPPGANTPTSIERDVDEWMGGAGMEKKDVNVRAEVRTLRVVWGESRAVIYANEEDLRFALDAIARFSVAQKETRALEATMKSTWASIEADAALTHALTMHEHKRQRHVNEMTEVTTRMKMAWLRVSRSLEQLNPAPTEPSKRLFAELVAAASLYDRVEMLENPVQFALDHYEISNTRLIDMYLAREDRVNSIFGYGIITILLIVQIWLMMPHG
ncbi:MAG TPA: hypothetical protein VLV50_05485 [Stellaceae bacterium]|nr:hypothetical protein [Stellaceae bacterium]